MKGSISRYIKYQLPFNWQGAIFRIKLIHKYGIKSCPYCNENYIINRRKKKEKSMQQHK